MSSATRVTEVGRQSVPDGYPRTDEFLAMSDEDQWKLVCVDWAWAHDQDYAKLHDRYKSRCVAVVGQQVVGASDDSAALRASVANDLGVHPEQVVIVVIDPGPRMLQWPT